MGTAITKPNFKSASARSFALLTSWRTHLTKTRRTRFRRHGVSPVPAREVISREPSNCSEPKGPTSMN